MPNESSPLTEPSEDDLLRLTQSMRTLVAYPEWKDYRELLKAIRIGTRESIVDSDADPAQLPVARGIVRGLTAAEEAPYDTIARGEQILKLRQQEERQRKDEPDLKRRLRLASSDGALLQPEEPDSSPTFAG